jgi:bile acid-coenzyme A ligase
LGTNLADAGRAGAARRLWYVDDGYLWLVHRRVGMNVTGGENVFPAEVEAALERHPAVRTSAVIGLPDDDLGQRVQGTVDLGGDATGPAAVGEAALRAHLATHLALQDPEDL